MPYISVIIPTHKSERTIEACLKTIRQSSFREYELIIITSHGEGLTAEISERYADKIVHLPQDNGRNHARMSGIKVSSGKVIVNIDSDVLIKTDTLDKIAAYFQQHQEVDALTGLLSEDHPNLDFFSQYKNLYMYYIFKGLPERVSFLYGSIYALRRDAINQFDIEARIADDTELGQKLITCGKQIAFLNDLEVIHLKKYNLLTFIKNDFLIPFDWSKIFLKYHCWKQLGKFGAGYAHSPKKQLVSVLITPVLLILIFGLALGYNLKAWILTFILTWCLLNSHFLFFLASKRGLLFGALAFLVTLADNIIMAAGITCGGIFFFASTIKKNTVGPLLNKCHGIKK